MTEPIPFPEVFSELQAGPLSPNTVRRAFGTILMGEWNPIQIAGFLTALRIRGESASTISAAAQSMREAMVRVPVTDEVVLDTCGTGGDGSGTVNLSTGAALICAALGITVAKHGNRAVSSQAGSADVLAALGIAIDLPAEAAGPLLKTEKIAFLLAPTHHPAMRFAVPARKELRIRTIFNCLGPLANPAGATHQLVGAFSDELRPILAETLRDLGTRRAWVVRGQDGLDEVSPYTTTNLTELREGQLRERTVEPEDFGLARSPEGAAKGGDAAANARIIEAVLRGEPHPARDAFVLNAAAAVVVALDLEPKAAATRAKEAIDSGAALAKLESFRTATQRRRTASG